MAAAPVESCQSVVLRSPWGRLGSVLYTCNRLHRMRRRIQHFWSISPSSPRSFGMNYLTMASRALGEHQTAASMAYAAQATTRHQTYLERPPGADLHPKKVNNLGPMAPRSRKKRKLPEAPSSRRSGLVGPHTTPPIVNYKYMASTPREGYFGLPTLGT